MIYSRKAVLINFARIAVVVASAYGLSECWPEEPPVAVNKDFHRASRYSKVLPPNIKPAMDAIYEGMRKGQTDQKRNAPYKMADPFAHQL